MSIIIKKTVSLDFLGDEYKDAYLKFQSIPLKDFDELVKDINKAQKEGSPSQMILDTLKKYFISGEFPGVEKLTADDLDGLDQESVLKCFSVFTGQEINQEHGQEVPQVADLKDASTTPSSTTVPGPTS